MRTNSYKIMNKYTPLILSILLLASEGAPAAEHWVAVHLPESVDSESIQVEPSGLRRAKIKQDCHHGNKCESIIRVELFDCQRREFTIESVETHQTDGTTNREETPPGTPSPPNLALDGDPIFDYVCAWKNPSG